MHRIILVVGTRPDIIKMHPLAMELSGTSLKGVKLHLMHTGQHYDAAMSAEHLKGYPIADRSWLAKESKGNVANDFHTIYQAALGVMAVLQDNDPVDVTTVVVYGDTLSALAVAQASRVAGHELVHVEAGLRSRDLGMPEEVARIAIDAMADLHCAPTLEACENLKKEGIPALSIVHTGNLISDVLASFEPEQRKNSGPILVTLHRRENREYFPQFYKRIKEIAAYLGYDFKIIRHPSMTEIYDPVTLNARHFIDPVGSLEMHEMIYAAPLVITDSGGLQEEAAALGTPCITFRTTTERPETLESGWNMLMHPKLEGWGHSLQWIAKFIIASAGRSPIDYSPGKTSVATKIMDSIFDLRP